MKGLRSFKACRLLTASTASFMRIKSMIHKTVLCLPGGKTKFCSQFIVKKLLSISVFFFYIYAMIGMEVYGQEQNRPDSKYAAQKFGDFSSLFMSFISLFQVLTLSG